MLHETILLNVPGGTEPARLISYVPDNSPELNCLPRPALIVCPGGGYEFLSDREGEPVALRFAGLGYAVFVLHYHVASQSRWPIPQRQLLGEGEPVALRFAGLGYAVFVLHYHVASQSRWPIPQRQLLAAIDHVRTNCQRYHIDPHAVIPLGFSAGGHLAGCAGTMWNRPEVYRPLKKKSPAFRPDGVILCYPVVSSGDPAHQMSFVNLLGDRYDELVESVSLEKRVTKNSPPMFLWHTADDTTVPLENSKLMAEALKARGVEYELRVFPHGAHGQSLADRTVYAPDQMYLLSVSCSVWVGYCDAWIQRHFCQ